MLGRFVLAAATVVTCFSIWELLRFVYRQKISPLHHLRGPKPPSLLYGSIEDIRSIEGVDLLEEWEREYGPTMKLKGVFNRDRLLTLDNRALSHILTHTNDYQKQPVLRHTLVQIFGEGLLVAEGPRHRQQRRIMNPAFGLGQIRVLTDIFFEKAANLRSLWLSEITKDPAAITTGVRIDVMPWLDRMTLDIIGLAGFNYDLGALDVDGKPHKLNEAFSIMSSALQRLNIMSVLQALIPPLRLIPTERAHKILTAQRTVTRIGEELLRNAKTVAQASATVKGKIEKDGLHGRDLLSLLVKANMAMDIPENQRLSDEDVLAQVPTFILAGHDTTSATISWALYAIARTRDVQMKLREEFSSVDTDRPSMDVLAALPYLDAFVRETLRMFPPVSVTGRVTMKDDIIPVEKPFTDKHGVAHDAIRVNKGDCISISIIAVNYSKELWGPDAHEFRPERWAQIPEGTSQVPGVWGNQLSFSGGPKGCIGYRFALAEIKAILFTLVRAFDFTLAVPASEIGSKASIVQRPVLRSDPTNKPQLPLLVRPYESKE